ncbi:uncharacterized protein [Diadema antillarum]|uniref:uncharacterized protein n=1 Tax=Diadema antillarum TaxID=105358 RepID=UPI003A8AD0AC
MVSVADINDMTVNGEVHEEVEKVVFCQHAKLFRFDRNAKVWKGCEVGDIKIVTNPKTNHARILMRREQDLELCVNQRITAEMVLILAFETSWVLTTNDFADEEPRLKQLSFKFKHADTARQFKEMFTKVQEMTADEKPEASQDVANEV